MKQDSNTKLRNREAKNNSIQETLYLNSTVANKTRLEAAITRVGAVKPLKQKLITKN